MDHSSAARNQEKPALGTDVKYYGQNLMTDGLGRWGEGNAQRVRMVISPSETEA